MPAFQYFVIYKPFQTLSQFSNEGEKKTLKDYFNVPRDVYPVGRLDYDSEGLLLLTNDKQLNQRLLHPRNAHPRTYLVQVDGPIDQKAIQQLGTGVRIKLKNQTYQCLPCQASLLDTPPTLPDRHPPIRFRQSIPAPWICITLTEGKNRQVRKMCAAVGFPVLRLVRFQIAGLTIEGMQPGDLYSLTAAQVEQALFSGK